MTRIFLPPEQLTSDEIIITGDNARHLSLVLRIQSGDSITIFDGQGYRYECTVQNVHKKEIIALLNKKEPYSVESPLFITLAHGVAKGDKMDFIIQKSTELGVSKIIPVITERTEVRHTRKIDRWRKIALSASQQSGRDKIPEIEGPVTYNDFINMKNPPSSPFVKGGKDSSSATETQKTHIQNLSPIHHFGKGACLSGRQGQGGILKLIFSESQTDRNLKEVLGNFRNAQHITLLVGPEGGFSRDEITSATKSGFIEVSLGPRVLRTETAPLAAISIIQYELGDTG